MAYHMDAASTMEIQREEGAVPISYSQLSLGTSHQTKDGFSEVSATLFEHLFVKLRASVHRPLTKRTSIVASAELTPTFEYALHGWSIDAQMVRKIGSHTDAVFGISFGSDSLSLNIGYVVCVCVCV
jgi:hypothetical protein